jgi:hypothetical protein
MKDFKEKLTTKRVIQISVSFIGLMAGIIAIYTFFFQEKKTQIDYEITTSTNIFDVNADVSELDFTYDGNSLKTNNKKLRLINLKIKNTGSESIPIPSYDIKDPLGVKITNGEIVEKPELVGKSNDYIQKNLHIRIDSSNNVIFNEIILDPGDFYIVKLLILHSKNESPDLLPIGKIAGVKNISVISTAQIQFSEEKSFLSITFGGNIYSQLLKLLSYSLLSILIIVLTLFLLETWDRKLKRLRRRKIICKYKKSNKLRIKKEYNKIFLRFIREDDTSLFWFNLLLKDENQLNVLYKESIIQANSKEEILREKAVEINSLMSRDLILELIEDGYVSKDKDKLYINYPLKNELVKFIDYLENKSYSTKDISEKNRQVFPKTIINGIIIHTAKYFYESDSIDVTTKINTLILQNKFELTITNDLMGEDPSVGHQKKLFVDYTINGERKTITATEGSVIKIY